MFGLLFHNLRTQDIQVGLAEWLLFLRGLQAGLVVCLDDLYGFARTVLCTSESQFDGYDIAFSATFEGVELPPNIHDHLEDWLRSGTIQDREMVRPDISEEELWEEFWKRLMEQEEAHHGGNRWIGTGGTSPFGHSGFATHGIRVGGASRNRSAMAMAEGRQWENYRIDGALETRDFKVALKALRKLVPEGEWELDVKHTIKKTADNGGEIELSFGRTRRNKLRLVLLMDSGGSMAPHARKVEQLFTAASEMTGFQSFEAFHFHNVPYGVLFRDIHNHDRVSIEELMREWTPLHRIVWVGDACMAPYELLSPMWRDGHTGIDWIQRIQRACPASVWLNPEMKRFWNHPTISTIGDTVPMYPLSVAGLRDAVKKLRLGTQAQGS